ncbi:hypothetical protein AZH51_18355 [Branchiibius sp. NY16-3462-2]|nr:hypothetical protein AZH51_18355 [Branchiibius sp. NY16-3462-2]
MSVTVRVVVAGRASPRDAGLVAFAVGLVVGFAAALLDVVVDGVALLGAAEEEGAADELLVALVEGFSCRFAAESEPLVPHAASADTAIRLEAAMVMRAGVMRKVTILRCRTSPRAAVDDRRTKALGMRVPALVGLRRRHRVVRPDPFSGPSEKESALGLTTSTVNDGRGEGQIWITKDRSHLGVGLLCW